MRSVGPRTTDLPPRVVLGLDPRDPYHRAMVEGVIEHTYDNGLWEVLLAPEANVLGTHLGAAEPPDGVIAVHRLADLARLVEIDVPTVLLLHHEPSERFDLITDDEDAVAALALDYFRELGLRRLAFFDNVGARSLRRLRFEAAVRQAELLFDAYPPFDRRLAQTWDERTAAVGEWVAGLHKPVGVLCFQVSEAQQLATACRRGGIAVPDEVAILSTNGDDIECHLAHPPLSAIDLGGERLGRAAAERLTEMMAGGPHRPRYVKLPPTGIARRQSTDLQAADDPHVAKAVRLIREQACEGVSVREIARDAGITRRRLEYAFKRTVGRTLFQQIRHERIERAKRLLMHTDLPLTDIALRCGFSYPARLSEAFRRDLDMTPTQYREGNQVEEIGR